MTAVTLEHTKLAQITILRILCAGVRGCKKTDLKTDLQPFVSHRLSLGEWRRTLDETLDKLLCSNSIYVSRRGRYFTTSKGEKSALEFLGTNKLPTKNWQDLKTIFLTAKALGIKTRVVKTLKPLKTADNLRAAIVKKYYDLPFRSEIPAAAQVRNALALQTIRDTFDAPVSDTMTTQSRVPEKLALFLASRNLRRPREIQTSHQLLTLLAAEAIGSVRSDSHTLRRELLRKLVMRTDENIDTHIANDNKKVTSMTTVMSQTKLDLEAAVAPNQQLESLNLERFSSITLNVAKAHAVGWAGNERAYISHVWKSLETHTPELGLNETQFKAMLIDAHRAGLLTLAIADLRDKENIADIQESATRYKNTEWHFIRVNV